MKKFDVYGVFTGTKYLGTYEAKTGADAEELAAESDGNYVTLCHQCSNDLDLDDYCATSFVVEEVSKNESNSE